MMPRLRRLILELLTPLPKRKVSSHADSEGRPLQSHDLIRVSLSLSQGVIGGGSCRYFVAICGHKLPTILSYAQRLSRIDAILSHRDIHHVFI